METFKITITTKKEVEVTVDMSKLSTEFLNKYNAEYGQELSTAGDVAKEAALIEAIAWLQELPGTTVKMIDEETTAEITTN